MEKSLKRKQRVSVRVDYNDYKWICDKFGTSSGTQFVNGLMRYYLIREKWFQDAANRGENLVNPNAKVAPPPERSVTYQTYLADIEAANTKYELQVIEKELNQDTKINGFEQHDLLRKLRGKKETIK